MNRARLVLLAFFLANPAPAAAETFWSLTIQTPAGGMVYTRLSVAECAAGAAFALGSKVTAPDLVPPGLKRRFLEDAASLNGVTVARCDFYEEQPSLFSRGIVP